MPNLECECCNKLFEQHLMATCCICKKYFKNTCVGLSNSDIRLINSNKGLNWTCANCQQIGNDINDLKHLIISLQIEIKELKENKANANSSPKNFNFEEVIEEINERNRRKRNLIIFGIQEVDPNIPGNVRHETDNKSAYNILNKIVQDIGDTNFKPIRLGRFDANKAKPRPIRITLEDENLVHEVIRNVKKLRSHQNYGHVSISFDRTPRQISYYKEIKNEFEARIKDGDTNCKIKYVNGIPKIVSLN